MVRFAVPHALGARKSRRRLVLPDVRGERDDARHGLGPVGEDDPPGGGASDSDDLCAIDEDQVRTWARTWRSRHGADDDDELRYVLDYLTWAQEFVEALATDGRGMVYLIG